MEDITNIYKSQPLAYVKNILCLLTLCLCMKRECRSTLQESLNLVQIVKSEKTVITADIHSSAEP